MKKALITGSSGFIGNHLTRYLKSKGYFVIGVDIEQPKYEQPTIFYNYDLRNQLLCTRVFDIHNDIDEVYNLGCLMGGMGYISDKSHSYDIMVGSTQIVSNIIDCCISHNIKKSFYSSSACVYNMYLQEDTENVSLRESNAYPAMPDLIYGWQKLQSELMYKSAYEQYGLNIRIARFHNIFGECFDDKTEVLTKEGWKFFKDTNLNDCFATMNDEKEMVYLYPIAKQEYMYNGDMYLCESRNNSQCITPNHKIYTSTRTTIKGGVSICTPFYLREVSSVKWDTSVMYFTSNFKWVGEGINDFYVLPAVNMKDGRKKHAEKIVSMKDWFEFIGWYVSEGSKFITPTNYTVCISQYEKTNSNNRTQIKNLLNRMDIHFSEDKMKQHIIISNKQVYNALELEGIYRGSTNKNIPQWMLLAPYEYIEILFDSLMKGDGDSDGGRYSTNSYKLANQFIELALKMGKNTNLSYEKAKKKEHNDIYRVSLWNGKKFDTSRHHRSIIPYNGIVYDVTLPKYHLLLVKRNGKTCWSGNCGTWVGGKEKYPAAISRKVAESNDGDIIEVWGDGKQTRSFLHVDTCIEGIMKLMDSDYNKPLNIGSDELVSIDEVANMVIEISGKKLSIKHNLDKPQGVRGRNSNNELIEDVLKWKPNTKLIDGLKSTYEWINNQVNNK